MHLTVAFLPFLQAQSVPTSLIFVSSGLALTPIPRCANYCATKAALHHLILSMREQLKGSNVKVIEVLPPAVQTELHNEKNQPDLESSMIGMPLEEFTDAAWEGLLEGKDQIPVGFVSSAFDKFEWARQEIFHYLVKATAAQKKS